MGKGIEGAGSPSTRRVEQPKEQEAKPQEQVKSEPSQQRAGREEQAQSPSKVDKNQDVRNSRGESNFESAPAQNRSRMPDLMPKAYNEPDLRQRDPQADSTPTPPYQSNGTEPKPDPAPTAVAPAATPTVPQLAAAEQAAQAQKSDPVIDPLEAGNAHQAAAVLKDPENPRYQTAEADRRRAEDHLRLSETHPDWMPDVYQDLGAERSSKLITDSVTALQTDNAQIKDPEQKFAAMSRGFAATDASLQQDIAREAARTPNGARAMGEVLGTEGQSDQTRRTFIDSTWDQALRGGNEGNRATYSRAIGDAMSGSQALFNEYGNTRRTDMLNVVSQGLAVAPQGNQYGHTVPGLENTGLEKMVGMGAIFRGADLADTRTFQTQLFRNAANDLDEKGTNPNRQALVDNLKTLYAADPRGITQRLFQNDGPQDTGFDQGAQALPRFMRDAVFASTDPTSDGFVKYLQKEIYSLRQDAVLNKDEKAAGTLGYMMGSVVLGHEQAQKQNKDTQGARNAMVAMLVPALAKLVPTPGKDAPVIGSLLENARKGAEDAVTKAVDPVINQDLISRSKDMQTLSKQLLLFADEGLEQAGVITQYRSNADHVLDVGRDPKHPQGV